MTPTNPGGGPSCEDCDYVEPLQLQREYIWMGGTPVAVVEDGSVYYIRTDHIGRPVFATDDSGTVVWEASYLPFGGVHTSTENTINLRFPGQWFQSESGLHQNWMRDYDPTTGRYIQADPLGLVDGASVYGYALQNPGRFVDPRGENILAFGVCTGPQAGACLLGLGIVGIGAYLLGGDLSVTGPGFLPNTAGDGTAGNVIPFPVSGVPDDIVDDGCGGDNDCPERYKTLVLKYGVLLDAIAEGFPVTSSAIRGYIGDAKKYNNDCVPKGYAALPTSFISGVN